MYHMLFKALSLMSHYYPHCFSEQTKTQKQNDFPEATEPVSDLILNMSDAEPAQFLLAGHNNREPAVRSGNSWLFEVPADLCVTS